MKRKAIALLSGGLDSTLAVKMMLDLGIEVEALNFTSPFCTCTGKNSGCKSEAVRVAQEFDILVATTVIEVGIDVPNATMMVVEHAERFGLSQLHQLRGRVGRGREKSYCILMSSGKMTEDGEKRLRVMESTGDGFRIAEADLEIRGAGDFLGTRQAGMPDFRVASILRDGSLLFTSARPDPDVKEDPEHKINALWLLPTDGGEARLLLAPDGGVDGVAAALKADAIVFGAEVHPEAKDLADDAARSPGGGIRPMERAGAPKDADATTLRRTSPGT